MYVVFRCPQVKRLYLAVSITIAKFANALAPCNLHKNRQIRQIRQHVRPISGDVICIKVAKFANTLGPSLVVPKFANT